MYKKIQSNNKRTSPYITRDGSEIRELMHPQVHGNRNQSLAEATIHPKSMTKMHKHLLSEEIYYVVSGAGQMTLGERTFPVSTGDTICIVPGTAHRIKNTENQKLVILCCCSPPYAHNDTILL